MINTNPCRYCTQETGRSIYCKSTCIRYLEHRKIEEQNKSIKNSYYQRQQKLLDSCGYFMGYTFLPSGKVRGCNVPWLKITYKGNIPHVALSENGLSSKFKLDQAMYKAFHPDYRINSKEIIHIDGNEDNCAIKNLMVANVTLSEASKILI